MSRLMMAAILPRRLKTNEHIRRLGSLATSTGPGRDRWPRLRDTERIQHAKVRLQARKRQYARSRVG